MVAIGRRLLGKDELQFRITVWIQLDVDKKEPCLGNQWAES